MSSRDFSAVRRLVVKVGTSTLTYDTGKVNLKGMEKLARTLSDLHNSGMEVILVSSGAISVGSQKLGLPERPRDTKGRQAASAVGQCELMFMYDKLFGEYDNVVGQLLLTRSDVKNEVRRDNLLNTFEQMLAYGAIPVVNENDSVAVEEVVFGDNDNLSAIVAELIGADLLVLLTDIDGLYTGDPRRDPGAALVPEVYKIDEALRICAGGRGSTRGTGGMITKIEAAELATKAGIPTVILNGDAPEKLYALLDGEDLGTLFHA